jgi:hypothetical protein
MKWFSIARICVMLTLVTRLYLHLSRLIFGIDLTLEKLVTTAFDSAFSFVLIFTTFAVFMARKDVLIHKALDRFLFYFTLISPSTSDIGAFQRRLLRVVFLCLETVAALYPGLGNKTAAHAMK